MDNDQMRKIAHALVEARGGLEMILVYKFPRASNKDTKKDETSKFLVKCCPLCFAPTWSSTIHADVDSWDITDYYSDDGFQACATCEGNLATMGPLERQVIEDMAQGHAIVLGNTILRMRHLRPDNDNALNILGAAERTP